MNDSFHDEFYYSVDQDEPGRDSCDACLIDTPLQKFLAPFEVLFKADSRPSSINRIKVKMDVIMSFQSAVPVIWEGMRKQ